MDQVSFIQNNDNKDEIMRKIVKWSEVALYWNAPATYHILDLKECHYRDVLRLIKRHFFIDDPLCRAINLVGDAVSIQTYLNFIQLWMNDTTSLVAVSSQSGRVIGTVIARINSDLDRSNTYSRIQISTGEKFEKIMCLKNTLIKRADAYKQLESETYFRIYILCVHPSYESRGLKIALIEACIQMVIALQIPAIGGIFSSSTDQELTKNLGFKLLTEIQYSRWIIDNEIVFDNPGNGNYSVAFMGIKTPSVDYLKKIWKDREDSIQEEKLRRENCHSYQDDY